MWVGIEHFKPVVFITMRPSLYLPTCSLWQNNIVMCSILWYTYVHIHYIYSFAYWYTATQHFDWRGKKLHISIIHLSIWTWKGTYLLLDWTKSIHLPGTNLIHSPDSIKVLENITMNLKKQSNLMYLRSELCTLQREHLTPDNRINRLRFNNFV